MTEKLPVKDERELAELALSVAHDFNNLLVGIIGNARILLEEDLVSPSGRKLVNQILKCSERSTALSDQILQAGEELQMKAPRAEKLDNEKACDILNESLDRSGAWRKQDRVLDTVLVIDDEEVVRTVSSRVLQRAGYTVMTAASGEEGLKLFEMQRHKIKCVLLDLTMPYISGNLVFARLKASDPSLKVYLMSGYGDRQALEQFDRTLVSGFIQKPFDPDYLVDVIDEREEQSVASGWA